MKKKNYFDDEKLFDVLETDDFKDIVEFLKPYGIDSYDRDGRTMLINLILEEKNTFFKDILKLEPNINHQDLNGFTALHFAIQEKNLEIIDLLLERKDLQIDLKDAWGNTVLLRLIGEEDENDIQLVAKLIKKGASLDIANNYNSTPRLSMQEITDEDIVDYSKFLN